MTQPKCNLHPERDRHEAADPAVLLLDDGRRIPIDRSCRNAELIADGLIVECHELEALWS